MSLSHHFDSTLSEFNPQLGNYFLTTLYIFSLKKVVSVLLLSKQIFIGYWILKTGGGFPSTPFLF